MGFRSHYIIPDTIVSVQRVELIGDGNRIPEVEWETTTGAVPINDVRDYGIDWKGVTNILVDGLSAGFGSVSTIWSNVLGWYFLDTEGGLVQ